MNTKTTAALIGGVAAVALIGGGTAYALNQPEQTTTTATETPAPEATVEPTPSAEPTPEATTPASSHSDIEALYISYLHTNDTLATLEGVTDEEFLAGGYEFCERAQAGEPYYDITIYPENGHASNVVRDAASLLFCPDVYEANVGSID